MSALIPYLVIIGPSGSGKSTAIRYLADNDLIIINPTWTTRPPRMGETEEGIEHIFVSEEIFLQRESEGFFVDAVSMFGLPHRYGLPPLKAAEADKPSLVMLRASLLPLLNKHYPHTIVYHIEDEYGRVKTRLLERQQQGEEMGSRLEDYEKEVRLGRKLSKRIFVNEKLDNLCQDLAKAIREDFGS